MAIDRRLKQKKKREEKQKSRRLQVLRELQHEKAEDYDWEARSAFRAQDYKRTLLFAQKKLKLDPSDSRIRALAIESARILDDREVFYNLLCQAYEHGELTTINNCLIFAQSAYARKDYRLAKEVFQRIAAEPRSLQGRLTKAVLKEVEQYLRFCSMMERPTFSPPVKAQTAAKEKRNAQPRAVPPETDPARPQRRGCWRQRRGSSSRVQHRWPMERLSWTWQFRCRQNMQQPPTPL